MTEKQTSQAEHHVDWIDWTGGECPVPAGALVEVELRNGEMGYYGVAHEYKWRHSPDDPNGEVVRYRVMEPSQPSAADAQDAARKAD